MKRKKIYQRGQAQASGSWSVFEWSNSYFTSKNEAFQYDAQVAGDRPNGYYGSFRSVDAVEINGKLFKLTPIKATKGNFYREGSQRKRKVFHRPVVQRMLDERAHEDQRREAQESAREQSQHDMWKSVCDAPVGFEFKVLCSQADYEMSRITTGRVNPRDAQSYFVVRKGPDISNCNGVYITNSKSKKLFKFTSWRALVVD